jgi:hypothetical protein
MTNHRTRIPSAFTSLAVIGFVCTGCSIVEDLASKVGQSLPKSQQPVNQTVPSSQPTYPDGQVPAKFPTSVNGNDGILGLSSQKIFDVVLFLMGSTGITLGILGFNKAKQVDMMSENQRMRFKEKLDEYKGKLNTMNANLVSLNEALNAQSKYQKAIDNRVEQLAHKYVVLSTESEYQSVNQLRSTPSTGLKVSLNQQADLMRTNADQNRAPGPSINLFGESQLHPNTNPFGSTPIKTAAQKQEELTAAVNRNDRQAVKNAILTQLNITSESESAYAIGKLVQTELEAVNGGGSYLLMELEKQLLLYPTDQTLKGFGQAQPTKGVFTYVSQPIGAPQVLTPALLELIGKNWRVKQLGTIAVPG